MAGKDKGSQLKTGVAAIAGAVAGAAVGAAAVALSDKNIRKKIEKTTKDLRKKGIKEVEVIERKAEETFSKGKSKLIEKLEEAKARLEK